jgi:hypothetical protein
MIVEAIFATLDPAGRPNFAPMGVVWGEDEMTVRPFRATHTYQNLLATRCGVVNVTDDVLAFVDCALGDPALPHFPATTICGAVLENACYWREVVLFDGGGDFTRAELRCRVVRRGWRRDFLGFNRARGVVIEAAILVTRVHLLGKARVLASLAESEAVVLKTGDAAEWLALRRLRDYAEVWSDETSR